MTHHKVIIIGSGPAGYSAAIYAARANLNPLLLEGYQAGGQLTITTDVENYPGFAEVIQGPWLMQQMKAQALHVGTKIIADAANKVEFGAVHKVWTDSSGEFTADSIIISTGASAKWLGLASEKKFVGFGVSGCATCDGFFYRNKVVAVVGGGNTAVEEAIYLTNHASKVYLIHRRDSLKAEKILQDRLLKNPKIEMIWDSELAEVKGVEGLMLSVNSLDIRNLKTGNISNLPIDGVFIAIGHKPNTDIFTGSIELDSEGYIITEKGSTKTSVTGVFAAGDVQDKIYRQAITAAGTGCMAALDAQKYLEH
jgi:thioredoxin reductase (NADPH)